MPDIWPAGAHRERRYGVGTMGVDFFREVPLKTRLFLTANFLGRKKG